MKIIARIASLCLIILTSFLLTTSVYASLDEIYQRIQEEREKNSLMKHTENEEVLKIMESKEDDVRDGLKNIAVNGYQRANIKEGFDKAYKVHYLEYGEDHPFERFQSGVSFKNFISDFYVWEVPVFNRGAVISTYTISQNPYIEDMGNLINFSKDELDIIKKNQGKWDLKLIGNYFPEEGITTFLSDEKLSKLISKNNLSNISDVKVVSLREFFSYIIYFNSNNKEYVIPYTYREDLTGLKSGSVYSVDDFIEVLEKNIKRPPIKSIPDNILDLPGGGFPAANFENTMSDSVNNSIFFYLIPFILMIFVFSIILYYKKRSVIND
ncbi:UNVERIFIED_CONTAM: hypothetical protein Cloal_1578 [Acetivibrio alkalicellulosi]